MGRQMFVLWIFECYFDKDFAFDDFTLHICMLCMTTAVLMDNCEGIHICIIYLYDCNGISCSMNLWYYIYMDVLCLPVSCSPWIC